MKKYIESANAPSAPHLYSPAVLTKDMFQMEIAGQIGIDSTIGGMVDGGLEAETQQILNNDDYAAVNEIYTSRIQAPMPARVAVAVKELPLGAKIEIEAVAAGETIEANGK